MPEALYHSGDGGTDSVPHVLFLTGGLEGVDPFLMGEGHKDELDLGARVVEEEWIFVDVAFFEETKPMAEVAALLGLCLSGDPVFCGIDSSVDAIQEERAGGRSIIVKVEGAWGRVRRKVVRCELSR